MALPFMIRRVELRNYRSIEHCDVELGPLMFLVGPNASGKSNFLDALRFVADCLNTSVDQALRSRGGFRSVCRRSLDAHSFSIKLTMDLENKEDIVESPVTFEYSLEIVSHAPGSFEIGHEVCRSNYQGDALNAGSSNYDRVGDHVSFVSPSLSYPPAAKDRLYLGSLRGWIIPELLSNGLATMAFYNPNIQQLRDHQNPDLGDRLNSDASNFASVFRYLRQTHSGWAERVVEYLSVMVPRLQKVTDADVGEKMTLQFTEATAKGQADQVFYASSMSDGTLRLLAILLALLQRSERVSLVGIEEPEMGLHPGGTAVLFDCLNEASVSRQVIVTSHSSDLLDRDDVEIDSLLAVSADEGPTRIGPIDERQKSILRKKLRTAGDLLRREMLSPPAALPIHS